jgi:F-type H+-transporting ATPase subunit a
MNSPLDSTALFQLGPVPITQAIVTTWAIMVMLVVGAFFLTRRLDLRPTRRQAALELMVATLDTQISETTGAAPAPYRGFIGTLFVFILVANWSSLVPGIEPPTARLETDGGLAILVFLSVIWFGIRQGGVGGWLKSFAAPNPVMIPLNILQSLTRVFSMFVRLFGNVMSGVFVVGIVASLAGLLVPIPLMALDLLTGLVQAYIFAVLAMVFITSAVETGAPISPKDAKEQKQKGFLMEYAPIVSIFCAAFAVAFGAIGPALAEGRSVAAAMDAIARQPDAANTISRTLFVGLAMIETTAIYCLVIALLLLFANPLLG